MVFDGFLMNGFMIVFIAIIWLLFYKGSYGLTAPLFVMHVDIDVSVFWHREKTGHGGTQQRDFISILNQTYVIHRWLINRCYVYRESLLIWFSRDSRKYWLSVTFLTLFQSPKPCKRFFFFSIADQSYKLYLFWIIKTKYKVLSCVCEYLFA